MNLSLPNWLVFNRVIAWLGCRFGMTFAGSNLKDLPPQAVSVLFAELRRIKKKHGCWELVSVESADANVNITL